MTTILDQQSDLLQHVTRIPMSYGVLGLPVGDTAAASRNKEVLFRKVRIEAYRCVARADFDPKVASYAVVRHIDWAILFGDGMGKPLGLANAPTAETVLRKEKGWVTKDDLYALRDRARSNYTWVIGRGVDVEKKLDIDWEGPRPWMFGLPVAFTNVQPPLGSPSDVILADLRDYVAGIKQDIAFYRRGLGYEDLTAGDISLYDLRTKRSVWAEARVGGTPLGTSPVYVLGGGGGTSEYIITWQKEVIVCKTCGTVWPPGQLVCTDHCGASLQDPTAVYNVVCQYCGRIWPSTFPSCWDGVDGCGGVL